MFNKKKMDIRERKGAPNYYELLPEELVLAAENEQVENQVDFSKYDFKKIFEQMYNSENENTKMYLDNLDWREGILYSSSHYLKSYYGLGESFEKFLSTPEHKKIVEERAMNLFKYLINILEKSKSHGNLIIINPDVRNYFSSPNKEKVYDKYGYLGFEDYQTSIHAKSFSTEYRLLENFVKDFMNTIGYKYNQDNTRTHTVWAENDPYEREMDCYINIDLNVKEKEDKVGLMGLINRMMGKEVKSKNVDNSLLSK